MSSVHPRPAHSRDHPLFEVLTGEHALLHRGVRLLARFAEHARREGQVEADLARGFLRFFKVFGEHHRRHEERDLFPWLHDAGLQDQGGPLGSLRAEHRETRELLASMEVLIDALEDPPVPTESLECFCAFAERFASLLSEHEWKENHILYPLAAYLGWPDDPESMTWPVEGDEEAEGGPGARLREEFTNWVEAVERQALSWPPARIDLHPEPLGTEVDQDADTSTQERE